MKRTTAAQRLEQAHYEGYRRGRQEEQEIHKNRIMELKVAQTQAVTELIKVTTQNLSKAGYLISQLNKEKGW